MVAGPWLADTLKALRNPQALTSPATAGADAGDALQGKLRPYQQVGVQWLYLLARLGLGACLLEKLRLIQDRGNAGKAYQTTGDYDAVLRSHCRLDIRKP
jgi:hypothetical protein